MTMNNPQITFRNLDPSDSIASIIQGKSEKLGQFCERIMSCHVMIEAPHRHHHKGRLYHVRIDLTVPGEAIVVNHEGAPDPAHEDVYVAISDAFDAAKRQLKAYVQRRRSPEIRDQA
jgi:ribosomal subunit interface protein